MVEANAVFKLATDWLPKLGKALARMSEERAAAVDRVGRELLVDYRDLGPCYIEPDCQKYNPADDQDADEYAVEREFSIPVFRYLEGFIGESRPLNDGRKQLFMLSDAGMGKSSLLAMFAFAEIQGFWPKSYRCQVLKLGHATLELLAGLDKQTQTVLLLDALDEDPTAIDRIEARIDELLRASQAFHRVVITCRTQFFPQSDSFKRQDRVELGSFCCPVIYLAWFTETQVRRYLEKRFPKTVWERFSRRQNARSLQAEAMVGKIGSLRFRPLLLAHIQDLLDEEIDSGNIRAIYALLVKKWLQREQRKQLKRRDQAPTVEQLESACTILAVALDRKGKREMGEAEVKAYLPGAHPHITTLEIGGRSLLNSNSKGQYRFAHYSIQEFLVISNWMITGEAPRVFTDVMRGFTRGEVQICGVTVGFCYIPPGSFWMGSPENEEGRYEAEYRHQVQITNGFWLAETACTQSLWSAVMGSNPSSFKGPDRPVERVSHGDVMDFLSRLEKLNEGSHFRLPTEAEWEYACRAGSTTAYNCGHNINANQANFGSKLIKTADVKAYPANDWGLFQMHGNVWEWCADWYGGNDRSLRPESRRPDIGADCVLRGGSWINDARGVRSACRVSYEAGSRFDDAGFRLARG